MGYSTHIEKTTWGVRVEPSETGVLVQVYCEASNQFMRVRVPWAAWHRMVAFCEAQRRGIDVEE